MNSISDLVIALAADSKPIADPLIISLVFELVSDTNYVFRNFYYAVIYINWEFLNKKQEVYANTKCIIIIINRIFISIIIESLFRL